MQRYLFLSNYKTLNTKRNKINNVFFHFVANQSDDYKKKKCFLLEMI